MTYTVQWWPSCVCSKLYQWSSLIDLKSILCYLCSLLYSCALCFNWANWNFIPSSKLALCLSINSWFTLLYLFAVYFCQFHSNLSFKCPTSIANVIYDSLVQTIVQWVIDYASIDEENDELSNIWKLRNVNYHDQFNWSLTLGLSKVIFISLSLRANLSILLKS